MFCPNCGQQLKDGVMFCPNCGTALAAATQAAPVQQSPEQPVPPPQPLYQPEPQTYQPPQQPPQQTDPLFQNYQQPQQPAYQPQPLYQPEPQAYQPQPQAYQQPQQPTDPMYRQPETYAAAPVAAKKRSGKKGLLIGLGCVALAALVVGGIWFLGRSRKPDNKLLQAAERSMSDLEAYTESLPNLHKIVTGLEEISKNEKLHMGVEMENTVSYNFGSEPMTYGQKISVAAELDGKAGESLVTGSYAMNGAEIPFAIYADKEQLQIGSSALLDQDVYMVSLKDLGKNWNASALSELTEIKLPEEFSLTDKGDEDFLKTMDEAMTDVYGEEWVKIRDSFDVVEYEGTPHFGNEGVTYALTWDRDALKALYDRNDAELEDLFDVDDVEELMLKDGKETTAKMALAILGGANEIIKEQQFLVKDDKLVGLWVSMEMDNDPFEMELRLLGEKNPWEHITLKAFSDYSSYTVTKTYDVLLKKSDGELRIEAALDYQDSDGEEYSYSEGPYSIIYHDADGSITLEAEGEAVDTGMDLKLVPVDGGFSVSAAGGSSEDYYSQTTRLVYTVTGKPGSIAPLSKNAIDLLKLSEDELNALTERIEERIDEMGE